MVKDAVEAIKKNKVVAIIRGISSEQTLAVCEALLQGGISVAEITFDQTESVSVAQTSETIKKVCEALGEHMTIGAGTVLRLDQAEAAAEAGAQFFVTPNVDEHIICYACEHSICTVVGALTATECQRANALGADFVKLFPAMPLGTAYLKALRAPLSHIRFLAVGGITTENAAEFIDAGAVGVGIGASLVDPADVSCLRFDNIRDRAASLLKQIGAGHS